MIIWIQTLQCLSFYGSKRICEHAWVSLCEAQAVDFTPGGGQAQTPAKHMPQTSRDRDFLNQPGLVTKFSTLSIFSIHKTALCPQLSKASPLCHHREVFCTFAQLQHLFQVAWSVKPLNHLRIRSPRSHFTLNQLISAQQCQQFAVTSLLWKCGTQEAPWQAVTLAKCNHNGPWSTQRMTDVFRLLERPTSLLWFRCSLCGTRSRISCHACLLRSFKGGLSEILEMFFQRAKNSTPDRSDGAAICLQIGLVGRFLFFVCASLSADFYGFEIGSDDDTHLTWPDPAVPRLIGLMPRAPRTRMCPPDQVFFIYNFETLIWRTWGRTENWTMLNVCQVLGQPNPSGQRAVAGGSLFALHLDLSWKSAGDFNWFRNLTWAGAGQMHMQNMAAQVLVLAWRVHRVAQLNRAFFVFPSCKAMRGPHVIFQWICSRNPKAGSWQTQNQGRDSSWDVQRFQQSGHVLIRPTGWTASHESGAPSVCLGWRWRDGLIDVITLRDCVYCARSTNLCK